MLADQEELDGDSSEDADGAKFFIQLDKTQNSLDDISAKDLTNGTMWLKGATQMEPGSQETEQDRTKNDKADESLEETVKKAEQRLDTEVREIENILIHTPTVRHHSGSLEEYDFENLAAEAVQQQLNERSADMEAEWEEKEVAWKERRTNMERNWNHERQAIERDSREALEEQGSIQVSLMTHETDNTRKEFQAFKLEMSIARQTLQEIQSQNETLQRNIADQTKQMGQLQTIVAEIKMLKQEMRDEATKLDTAIHQTTQLRTNLQEEVTVKAHNTIQDVVDSKMVKVEQAIRDTLQKRGRTIVAHAKTEMAEQLKNYTQNVDKELEDKTEATFATAVSLLDQTAMKIGEEMDDALTDFNKTLTDTLERNRHMERIQKRVMNEIRPQVQELQDDFIKDISADIEMTIKNAQDDLHLNQGKLTKDTEERIK
jgi:hypothetical protein